MNMKITLELTVEEVNTILQGLGELPAKISMALIEEIHTESNAQVNKANQSPTLTKE